MPSERRLIRFTTAEVEEALRNFAAEHARVLPTSKVAAIEYHNHTEEGEGAQVKFENVARPTHFTPLETAAALIAYCRKIRVPIPKQGHKSILKQKDALILQLDIKAR